MSELATKEGTARFAARFSGAYRKLGRTGLTVSPVGFGGYRIDDRIPEHAAALEKALREGCNLVDTSTNYADGGSERLVGHVVAKLVESGALKRDEVVIVSKVGYVQGSNLEVAQAREFPDMVKYADGCWHCLHPEWIEDQLTRSLARLGMAKLDVYLLHNPEYFLSDAKKRGSRGGLTAIREQFQDRLRSAFAHLEEEVDRGRIAGYGVSSNTFGAPADDIETTSVSAMWEIAGDLAKRRRGSAEQHHFSVVQLPMNLFESGPLLEKNAGVRHERSALEFAAEKDLAVLVNRPLNAFVKQQLMRLASPPTVKIEATHETMSKAIASLEAEFARDLAPHIDTGEGGVPAKDLFRWGTELANPQLRSLAYESWMQIESEVVRPQVGYLVAQLDGHLTGGAQEETWKRWRDRYVPGIETLLAIIGNAAAKKSRGTAQTIAQRLAPLLPEEWRGESLSRQAIGTLAGTPGVTTVLVGMRRRGYVDDALGVMKLPPIAAGPDQYTPFRLPT